MHGTLEGTRGITLKALLVVLVIIGVIVALLVPVFTKMKDDAISAACRANLRKIGMAVQQYATDYNEFVPPAQWCGPKGAVPWTECLKDYLGNDYPAVYKCAGKIGTNIAYAVNYKTFGRNVQKMKKPNSKCTTLKQIGDKAKTIYILDTGKVTQATKDKPPTEWEETPEDAPSYCRVTTADKYWTEDPVRPMPRHANKVNCLMVGGSVKSYLVGDIIEPDEGSEACLWDAK